MKTDLSKILTVSGQHGLFRYVAPSRAGIIAETLEGQRRVAFDSHSKVNTLADIAIYTSGGEMKLKEVFLAIEKTLSGKEAPTSKSPEKDIVELFSKAVPDYDEGRFYLSHMKKVVDWYNELVKNASLDFEEEEGGEENA
ncbi:MAG: DUF5606 domain-containing protein [Bacteroidales bacterium]|nr:DUF5606 domain-containing protein [Bacteroidales bacterium]